MNSEFVKQEIIQGIPVYRFSKNHRQAVDDYLDQMAFPLLQAHIEADKVNTPICIVMDVSQSGMLPVNYMLGRVRQMFSQFKQLPEYYIAFITNKIDDSIVVRMIDGMTARNMANTRRIFSPEAFDDAIEWLVNVSLND